MSEHEIAKHTKAIYTAWKNPAHGWKHKLGEVLIEILIIVFAITLSLLVERWRESAHERTIEKQFLLGLKTDLQNDLVQLREDNSSYARSKIAWNYFYGAGKGYVPFNKDSIAAYQWSLFNNTSFLPNDSRFEALKSSGQFGVIEDDSLRNMIIDLYQNKIASLHLSTDGVNRIKNEQLVPYLFTNLRENMDAANNMSEIVKQPFFQNLMSYRSSFNEPIKHYSEVIGQSRAIIRLIDEQYNLKEN